MSPRRTYALTLILIVAAAGCSDTHQPVALESYQAAAASVEAAGHRVVGSGHVESEAGLREFTFHAIENSDGSAKGSYKVVLPNGLFFEADVTCLAVDGSLGWVAGVIRDTNAEIVQVGSTSMFWVEDGGEGSGATDRVSAAAFNGAEGADLAFCEDRLPEEDLGLNIMTVTQGNVQVR